MDYAISRRKAWSESFLTTHHLLTYGVVKSKCVFAKLLLQWPTVVEFQLCKQGAMQLPHLVQSYAPFAKKKEYTT